MLGKRLSKVLAAAGVAARRACEELIFAGRVQVNGEVERVPQRLVGPKDVLFVDGQRVKEEKKVYYVLHKPTGLLCDAPGKKRVVLDLFAHLPYRLFTVGRLDKETTGLLLVTNDGALANRMIHPRFGVAKEYLAKVVEEIMPEHLVQLSKGTHVEGSWVKPHEVRKVRRGTVRITVGEGKKREVRCLIEKAGLTIQELCRIRIGPLHLGKLPAGAWKEFSKEEMDALFPG